MPDHIPSKIYQYFSFEAGGEPDFEAMFTHFLPEGLFINNKGENPVVKPLQAFETFIRSNIEAGNILSLTESEIENQVSLFGKVGQITSQYKLEVQMPSGLQTRYGVNLFQIIQTDAGWKVSAMCWDDYPDERLFDD